MPVTVLECPEVKVTVTTTTSNIDINDVLLRDVVREVINLNQAVAVKFVKLNFDTGVKFKYEIKLKDDRKWKQDIFMNSPDPSMTFNVSDTWLVKEFVAQKQLRENLIILVKSYMDLVALEIIYA